MIIIKWSKALFLSAVVVMLSAGATSLSAQSGEYAYVATTAGGVSAFTIDQATGALTQLPGSPIQGGGTPRSFRLDPKGRFAFSLISHFYTCAEFFVPQRCGVSLNQGISSYSIDASTGSLSLIPGAPFAATWLPIYLAISPDGKSVYAVDYGGDYSGNSPSLLTYSVDRESGVLTQLAGRALVQLPANNSSGSVAIDSTARFLFVTSCPPRGRGDLTCDTAPVTLLAFAIGHKGDLTLAPDSPFSIGVDPTWIATDPAGKFLYVQSGGSIYAFAIDQASGGLTAVPGSPFGFNAVGGGIGAAMDPLGQFLFIANARGNTYVNRIDPSTGALAPVPGSPFAVGGDNSITADPTGRFVYMPRGRSCPTGQSSLCIDAAALDRTTGMLTPIPGSPFNVQVSNVFDLQGVALSPVSIVDTSNQSQ